MADAQEAVLGLLAARGDGKTICPSQAARKLAGPQGDWRAHMDRVHAAVDELLAQEAITLSWQGAPKSERRASLPDRAPHVVAFKKADLS